MDGASHPRPRVPRARARRPRACAVWRHAKPVVLAMVLLMVFGCGASPSVGDRANPAVVVSEPQTHTSASPEAPRATIVALQACADRYARRLSSDSYAILFDIEANTNLP